MRADVASRRGCCCSRDGCCCTQGARWPICSSPRPYIPLLLLGELALCLVRSAQYMATLGAALLAHSSSARPRRMLPWAMFLVCASLRLHSIYVLRLFDDGWAMLGFWVAVAPLHAVALEARLRLLLARRVAEFGSGSRLCHGTRHRPRPCGLLRRAAVCVARDAARHRRLASLRGLSLCVMHRVCCTRTRALPA